MSAIARHKGLLTRYLAVLFIIFVLVFVYTTSYRGYSDSLGSRSVKLDSAKASANTSYLISFNTVTAGNIGSVKIQFCSNDPLVNSPCIAPSGFDASSASLASQQGITGFSISNISTNNEIVLTRTSSLVNPSASSYEFTNIINPDAVGSYYARIITYASSNASGNYTDYGGLAFAITSPIVINATVPPYLIFCNGVVINGLDCANIQGDFIDLGELSPSVAKNGTSQMLITTNAELGYNVVAQGTTMTSGVNVIANLINNDISRPGTSQFGVNLRSNSSPSVGSDPQGTGTAMPVNNYNQPNLFRFNDGDLLVANVGPDEPRLFTVSYVVNISPAQAAGVYTTTITYVAFADF